MLLCRWLYRLRQQCKGQLDGGAAAAGGSGWPAAHGSSTDVDGCMCTVLVLGSSTSLRCTGVPCTHVFVTLIKPRLVGTPADFQALHCMRKRWPLGMSWLPTQQQKVLCSAETHQNPHRPAKGPIPFQQAFAHCPRTAVYCCSAHVSRPWQCWAETVQCEQEAEDERAMYCAGVWSGRGLCVCSSDHPMRVQQRFLL